MTIGNKTIEHSPYTLKSSVADGTVQETTLQTVHEETDVGVTTDDKLKFEQHTNMKVNKANSIMGVIRRTFVDLNEKNFTQLYKALVRPHLEYAGTVWSPRRKTEINKLEGVQRRATKLVPSLKHMSYIDRLKTLKLPSLTYRRLRGDMIEVYKILNVYDSEVVPCLPLNTEERTRGHSQKLFKQPPGRKKLNLRKQSFTQRVVATWNDLPENVVSAPNLKTFERRLDRYWENQELLYDYEADITKRKSWT